MSNFMFYDNSVIDDILAWSKQKRDANSNWYLFDKVLYDLCQQYPRHNNPHEIVAKIAMIGRAYSASVERRNIADNQRNLDFFYVFIAPLIINSDLDERLDALKQYKTPTPDNLPEILATHLYLQELLKKVTERDNRSFSSKYLHFHFPNLFYLYDFFSKDKMNEIVKHKGRWHIPSDSDREYAMYCQKSLFVQQQLLPDSENAPRIIDSFLQTQSRGYKI